MQGNAIVGKAYKWKPSGAIFICIAEDLETWIGVVIYKNIKGCAKEYKVKLGQVHSLNADSNLWIPIEGKLKISEQDSFNIKTID